MKHLRSFKGDPGMERKVLNAWMLRSVRAVNGHYESAREFEWRARWLSVTALFATLLAAVLTALILAVPDRLALRIVAAVMGVVATALGLLQANLDLAGRAERHRAAGSGYSRVRRELEALSKLRGNVLDSRDFRDLEHLYSEISRSAPTIPEKVWKNVLDEYQKDEEELILWPAAET